MFQTSMTWMIGKGNDIVKPHQEEGETLNRTNN